MKVGEGLVGKMKRGGKGGGMIEECSSFELTCHTLWCDVSRILSCSVGIK